MHQRNFSSISIQHHFPSYVICWCLTWLSELEQKARRNSITFQITSEIEFINQWTLLSIPSSFKNGSHSETGFYMPSSIRFFQSPITEDKHFIHVCILACTSHPTANLTSADAIQGSFSFRPQSHLQTDSKPNDSWPFMVMSFFVPSVVIMVSALLL